MAELLRNSCPVGCRRSESLQSRSDWATLVPHPRRAGGPLEERGASLHAAGASVDKMGAAPGRRSAAPAPCSDAPARRNSAPAPRSDAPARRNSAPAPRSDAPAGRNSAPAASGSAPAPNGGGVSRRKTAVSGPKAAPRGKIGRLERKSRLMAGGGWDAADQSTDPARCVCRTSPTPAPTRRNGATESCVMPARFIPWVRCVSWLPPPNSDSLFLHQPAGSSPLPTNAARLADLVAQLAEPGGDGAGAAACWHSPMTFGSGKGAAGSGGGNFFHFLVLAGGAHSS